MKSQKKVKKNKPFESTKELVTWLIGVLIFIALSGYLLYFGIQEEDPVVICVACFFLVSLFGIGLGMIHTNLAGVCLGIALIIIGWVIPLLDRNVILLLFTFIFGAIGFAMILEVFVTISNTRDSKFYKKYGEFLVQLLTFYTAEEGTVGGKFHHFRFRVKQIFRILMLMYFVVFGLVVLAFGIFAFTKGEMSIGAVMVIIALIFVLGAISIYRKGR